MIVKYKKKNIEIFTKKVSFFGEFSGLMFRTRNTSNLLFEFKKNVKTPIHSFFVFFKFLVLWLDDKNKVMEYKVVGPFRFYVCPKMPFARMIEIPFNEKNESVIKFFVEKR